MPAIIPFVLGFVAGLLAGLSVAWAWLLVPALCALAAVLLPALRGRARSARVTWLAAALGAAAGVSWGTGAAHAAAGDCRTRWRDGQRLALLVEPRDLPDSTGFAPYGLIEPRVCRGGVSLVLPRDTSAPLSVLAVVGTWRRNPGVGPAWLPRRPARAGALVVARFRAVAVRPSLRARLRIGAERRLAALFGPRRAGLAAALTVSPDARVPPEERRRFARTGLAHLLSISGFHVGILAAALIVALRAARLRPDAARVAGTLLVAAYVWMLGYPAPALRAAALLALWAWCRVRQRPPVAGATLATAALAVLALDPFAVGEAGPWLSFGGAWGCAAAAGRWREAVEGVRDRKRRRLLRHGEAVAVSAGAFLATAPISVLAFGTIAPVAVVANLAAVPLAALAVPAIALALMVAWLPLAGSGAVAALPAAVAGLALDVLDRVTRLAAAPPWASVAVEQRVLAALVTAVGAWLVLRAARTGEREGFARLGVRLAAAGVVAACAVVWQPVIAAWDSSDGDGLLTLHFLAVGEGDAAVLRTPAGRWIVIDGGPRLRGSDAGQRVVVPFLRAHGARRVALAVASHADADHLGGLPAVIGALPVDLVLEPGEPNPGPLYWTWLATLQRAGLRWHRSRAGERLAIDGVTIRVWHPDSAWLAQRLPANENSLVLSVEYGAFRAVFPGDAGLPMEIARAAEVGAVTLLKVSHHGSRTATGTAWLTALHPRVCVVSVGRNRYGHPDGGTLGRLGAAGCAVWRTDRAGGVTVETDGHTLAVRPRAGRDTTIILSREQP
jgi:competence protein ComEC